METVTVIEETGAGVNADVFLNVQPDEKTAF
jgi:hypothetical protein